MEVHSKGWQFEKCDRVQWRCIQMAAILKSMTCFVYKSAQRKYWLAQQGVEKK
jgi:hypothetical protein